jgi:hypothetical protein
VIPLCLILLAAPDGGSAPVALSGTASRVITDVGRWGGAAPRPGEAESTLAANEVRRAHPELLAGVRFVVLPGSVNNRVEPIAEFTPDPKGRFSVKLPPGSYCVVEASRRLAAPAPRSDHVDAACMAALDAACDVRWMVTGRADASVTLNVTTGGAPPCWTGPSPP